MTSLTFWRRPCFLAYRAVMGCAFLWGQAAAVPVLQCLGNGEPLAEGGAVLTPCNSGLCPGTRSRLPGTQFPASPQQLGVLRSGCSPPHARRLSTFVFKTSCLIARLHRLPFTSRSGGTFQPSPSRPPGAASPWRLSQTAVPRVSSDPPCSARDPQDVSPRLHG